MRSITDEGSGTVEVEDSVAVSFPSMKPVRQTSRAGSVVLSASGPIHCQLYRNFFALEEGFATATWTSTNPWEFIRSITRNFLAALTGQPGRVRTLTSKSGRSPTPPTVRLTVFDVEHAAQESRQTNNTSWERRPFIISS